MALASAVSLLITGNALASNTYFDARNDAMGGVGVASSLDNSALLANPALIAKTDQVILKIPSLGLQLSDKNHLIDELIKIKCSTHPVDARQMFGTLKSNLEAVKDKKVNFNIGGAASFIIPHENTKVGFFAKSQMDATLYPLIEDGDLRFLEMISNDPVDPSAINFQQNIKFKVHGLATWVTDYGISVARTFEVAGKPLHIGLSPKMQDIKIYNCVVDVNHHDRKDIKDQVYKRFNVDLGLAAELSEQLTVGLVGKNLLSNNLKTKVINDKSFTYQISPVVTAGTAYRWDNFTAVADVDLTPVKAFSNQKGSRYAGIGVEWEALSWMKLRAGYRLDMKKSKPNIATVGFGFHPSKKVKFDMAGMAGSKLNLGIVLQMSFAI